MQRLRGVDIVQAVVVNPEPPADQGSDQAAEGYPKSGKLDGCHVVLFYRDFFISDLQVGKGRTYQDCAGDEDMRLVSRKYTLTCKS